MNYNCNQTKLKISTLVFLLSFGFKAQAVIGSGFAAAANSTAETILPLQFVTFDFIEPNSGITPPASGGDTFTVNDNGTYLIMFQVRGVPASPVPLDPLIFDLVADGVFIPGSRFESHLQTSNLPHDDGTLFVNGQVLVTLNAGTRIKLRNFTKSIDGGRGETVFLRASKHNPSNAALTIIRLSIVV